MSVTIYQCHIEQMRDISFSYCNRFLVATLCRNDIYSIYTIILVFPICVDKFLTDVNLLGLEVT